MSNLSNTTQGIDIQHPEFWTLQLCLRKKEIQYTLFDVDEDNSLIAGSLSLDQSTGSYLKAVENAIYDNPVLVNDYKKVRVIIESQHFMILPPEVDDEEAAQDFFEASMPSMDGDFAMCQLPRCNVGIAFEAPKDVIGFLQRTFNMPQIVHHLYPILEHYKYQDDSRDDATMHLNMREESFDLLITNKRRLVMANTYPVTSANDTVYFVLNAWKLFGLDVLRNELLVTGTKAMRDEVIPTLRTYISYVMPAIFPAAALRIGQDAVKAPLSLILLALCE